MASRIFIKYNDDEQSEETLWSGSNARTGNTDYFEVDCSFPGVLVIRITILMPHATRKAIRLIPWSRIQEVEATE